MICAPSEDSDQPGHLHAYSEDWLDCSDGQADLSLRWAHMPFCWFCHAAAHLLTVGAKLKFFTQWVRILGKSQFWDQNLGCKLWFWCKKKLNDFEIICPATGVRPHPRTPSAYGSGIYQDALHNYTFVSAYTITVKLSIPLSRVIK